MGTFRSRAALRAHRHGADAFICRAMTAQMRYWASVSADCRLSCSSRRSRHAICSLSGIDHRSIRAMDCMSFVVAKFCSADPRLSGMCW